MIFYCYINIINHKGIASQDRGLTNKVIKRKEVGKDGGEVKIYNESGGEVMKEKRKVVIEHIEKDIIYVHNLIEILVNKYHQDLAKNRKQHIKS